MEPHHNELIGRFSHHDMGSERLSSLDSRGKLAERRSQLRPLRRDCYITGWSHARHGTVVGEFDRDNFQQILLFLILDTGLLTGRVGMMGEFSPLEPGPKDTSPLIDLGDVSLDDVARMDDSALVHSLNRILGDAASPDEVILASFSASV